MEAQTVIIENETDLAAAQALVSKLGFSSNPTDVGRLRAQALILHAYEAKRWPTSPANPAEIMAYLIDQHDLGLAVLRQIFGNGAAARVSEILAGSKGFSLGSVCHRCGGSVTGSAFPPTP